MPKLIDHDRRQEKIAKVIWRVIHAQGVGGVSIRTVAVEARISTDSLRHVLPSKADLLIHAMKPVRRRAQGRIEEHLYKPDPRALVLAVVKELLPLNVRRRAEIGVDITLIAEAPGGEHVKEILDVAHATVRNAYRRVIAHLHRTGLTAPDLNVEGTTTLLHGLVDGFAIHMPANPDPAFERQALGMIETTINGLRPIRLRGTQRRFHSFGGNMRR